MKDQTPGATTGAFRSFIDDRRVNELPDARIQNGKFALAGEGLNVGRDGSAPVTSDYSGERPWGLRGATIAQVVIEVSGDLDLDLEKESIAMFNRD